MATLIFDYDGTLHDSMHIYGPAVRRCHQEMAAKGLISERVIAEEEIRSYLGLSIKEMWLRFAPELSEDERAEGGKVIGTYLRESVKAGKAVLYDGALSVLSELRDQGHKLVFLSNCTESYMELHCSAFGLDQYFHEMYCSEQFGWKEKYEIASVLMKKWRKKGWNPPVVAIGDRNKDIDMRKAMCPPSTGRVKTIWCSYGFGMDSEGVQADAAVHSVREILSAIKRLPA